MRVLSMSILALSSLIAVVIATPRSSFALPSVAPVANIQSANGVEEVGYRYRRWHRRQSYYRPYYGYSRPYYRPYYRYTYGYPYSYRPYYYRPWWRPGFSIWFGF
jgi:hypothetical protein